jgi:hypothetical protein
MAYLRDLPPDVDIYTNEPAAVYLYVGRGAKVLPSRYDSATTQERSGFDEGVLRMQDEINNGLAVMALFDGGDKVASDLDKLTDGLHNALKTQGDSIYTAGP